MLFRQLFDSESSTYTYLLADAGQAVLIDPVKEKLEDYLRLLDSYYHQWGAAYAESPVLTVNSHRIDFVNNPSHLQQIIDGIAHCIRAGSSLNLAEPAM